MQTTNQTATGVTEPVTGAAKAVVATTIGVHDIFSFSYFLLKAQLADTEAPPSNIPNRVKLDQILQGVQGKSQCDNNLLRTYFIVNRYCDSLKVELTESELGYFEKNFTPGVSISYSDLLIGENELLSTEAKNFKYGSLNYHIRTRRIPDFLLKNLHGQLDVIKKSS